MAYTWYYQDGDNVPTPDGVSVIVKSQANDNLRGNIIHIDPLNGITIAGHPNNPGVEENGSPNFPYKDIQEYITDYGTLYTIDYLLIAPTVIINRSTTYTSNPTNMMMVADRKYVIFNNTGVASLKLFNEDLQPGVEAGFVGCIIQNFDGGLCEAGASERICKLFDCKVIGSVYSDVIVQKSYAEPIVNNSVYIGKNVETSFRNLPDHSIVINCTLRVSNTAGSVASKYTYIGANNPIFVNDSIIIIEDFTDLSCYFDGGSITVGAQPIYNIDTAVATMKTEAQIIADIEALFDAEYGGTHTFSNLRIVDSTTPLPFVNKAKGNYLFDVNDSGAQALYDSGYGIGVGYGLDYDTTEANSNFVNSVTSPHYTTGDGFLGFLYCRNINADGSVDNASNDSVWVSEKTTMPFSNLEQTNFNGLLNALDIGDQNDLELYFAISVGGNLEDVFNSTDYTFSYGGGALTIDFPRFNFGDTQQQVNKLNDLITNEIEKGSYNKDTGDILYSNSGVQFRIIIVKRGV